MNIIFTQFLMEVFLLTIVFLHVSKKNTHTILAYSAQSLVIAFLLLGSFMETGDPSLLVVALVVLIVKVILAPTFIVRLIKKNNLKFSVSKYLSTPLTLVIIAVLVAIAYSNKFLPLTSIVPANHALLSLAVSAMFLSLFLVVNRRGAISQMTGILSLENSIVAFATFAGLEQSVGLQIGVIFDILVWLIIVSMFISMIFKHFGTLDVTLMKNLKE